MSVPPAIHFLRGTRHSLRPLASDACPGCNRSLGWSPTHVRAGLRDEWLCEGCYRWAQETLSALGQQRASVILRFPLGGASA